MALAMSIKVDDAKVTELFARAPQAIHSRLGQLIEGAAIDIQREMREVAPVAVTGDLRKSIRYTYSPALLRANIGPSVKYAERVELGGPPVTLSIKKGAPLREWAELKGLNPFAIRNSIAKKGTKEHPFVGPTYDKMKPTIERDIASGIAKIVEDFNR